MGKHWIPAFAGIADGLPATFVYENGVGTGTQRGFHPLPNPPPQGRGNRFPPIFMAMTVTRSTYRSRELPETQERSFCGRCRWGGNDGLRRGFWSGEAGRSRRRAGRVGMRMWPWRTGPAQVGDSQVRMEAADGVRASRRGRRDDRSSSSRRRGGRRSWWRRWRNWRRGPAPRW